MDFHWYVIVKFNFENFVLHLWWTVKTDVSGSDSDCIDEENVYNYVH